MLKHPLRPRLVIASFLIAQSLLADSGLRAQCNAQWDLAGGAPGFNGPVQDLIQTPNGLYACGTFTTAGGVAAQNVARWNGTAWQSVGPLGSTVADVRVLLRLANGSIAAGGTIYSPPLANPAQVSVNSGGGWVGLGGGVSGGGATVHALIQLPNGDLVAGGSFHSAGLAFANNVAVWNGSSWSGLSTNIGPMVEALAVAPGGGFYAGGSFVTTVSGGVANRIARWSGSFWFPLGSGMDGTVYSIRVLDNGDVIAGGSFATAGGVPANGIARFVAGSGWSPLGSGLAGSVMDIRQLPNGDLVAGGVFQVVGNPSIQNLARFDAATSTWGALAPIGSCTGVLALELTTQGELAAATNATVGTTTSQYFARLVSGCPAAVASYGSGCPGHGGFLTLTSVGLPWAGTTMSLHASGFGASSLGLAVMSLTQANVLISTIPDLGAVAGPTCLALAPLDLSSLVIPVQGEVSWDLVFPNSASLAGIDLFHQGIELEFGINGITFIGSTNGVRTHTGAY